MTNSNHKSEKEAQYYLERKAEELGLVYWFIDSGTIGQKDCLLLIKEDKDGEPIRTVECAEY